VSAKPGELQRIISKVAEVVRPFANRVVVAAFSQPILNAVRDVTPSLNTSCSEDEIRSLYLLSRMRLGRLFRTKGFVLQVPLWSNYEEARGLRVPDRWFLRAAHRRGLPVTVWVVNDPEEMRHLIDAGVDGITTDRPDVLNKVLASADKTHVH
jgi:glycerophosphoryl diester phosphodiesterase